MLYDLPMLTYQEVEYRVDEVLPPTTSSTSASTTATSSTASATPGATAEPVIVPPGGSAHSSRMQVDPVLQRLLRINGTYDLNKRNESIFRSCRDSGDVPPDASSSNATANSTVSTSVLPNYRNVSNAEVLQKLSVVLAQQSSSTQDADADQLWRRMRGLLSRAGRMGDIILIQRALDQLKTYFSVVRERVWQALREFAQLGETGWEADLHRVVMSTTQDIVGRALNSEPVATQVQPVDLWMSEARKVRLAAEQAQIEQLRANQICTALADERRQMIASHAYYHYHKFADTRNAGDWYWLPRGRVHFESLEDAFKHGLRGELSIRTRTRYEGGVLARIVEEGPRGKETQSTSLFTRGKASTPKRFVHVDYGKGSLIRDIRVRTHNGTSDVKVYLGDEDYVVGDDGEPTPYPWLLLPQAQLLNMRYLNCAVLSAPH